MTRLEEISLSLSNTKKLISDINEEKRLLNSRRKELEEEYRVERKKEFIDSNNGRVKTLLESIKNANPDELFKGYPDIKKEFNNFNMFLSDIENYVDDLLVRILMRTVDRCSHRDFNIAMFYFFNGRNMQQAQDEFNASKSSIQSATTRFRFSSILFHLNHAIDRNKKDES